jgi:hypothetical protein
VKEAASAALSELAPKRKKMKVLTHQPRYIESAIVPEFVGETSSATEAKEPTPLPNIEELATMPEMEKIEEPRAEETKTSEILSPSAKVEVSMPMPRALKDLTTTPKRKRMVNVLDVLETIKSSSSTSKIAAEIPKTQTEAEAAKGQAETETGLSESTKREFLEIEKETEKESAEEILSEKIATPIPEASSEASDYVLCHASGKNLTEKEKREAQFYAQKLKYPKGALIFNGSGEEDFLYCLPNSKEISVCREMSKSFGFPTLENGLSVLSKDELADSLAYNSLKVKKNEIFVLFFEAKIFICLNLLAHFFQGLILSNALRAQKDAEDEGCTIALSNLRSEVIELRNEGLEKNKILHSLMDKIKEDEAAFKAQAEAQKREIEDLRKQLAEAKEKCTVEEAKREISEQWANHLEKNAEELRASKKRCYEKSIECVKKIKTSFASVGAFSSEENFIRGEPEGPIEWISHEAKAFEEVLNSRKDICAFSGARGIATILERKGCDHVKSLAQTETDLSSEDIKDPSGEASLVGGKFFTDIWENGGREMAQEIIRKSEKGIHDARKVAEAAEKSADLEGRLGIDY